MFLGVILTSLELQRDAAAEEGVHCGSCTRCLDACPTEAFLSPHRIDARRCISYLTIEHDGPIPTELRPKMGNRIYGCDDCLAVCPWNRFADAAAANRAFLPRAELAAPKLADLLTLDDASFREMFAGSPIKRIGRNKMIRNCLIAAGNSGDAKLRSAIEPHLADPDPVLAEAARWSLYQLADSKAEMQAA
jgi:epoxyqueuosine reductase